MLCFRVSLALVLSIPFLQLSPNAIGVGVFDIFLNLEGGSGAFDCLRSLAELI